jgi:hypothetical protein
MAVTPYSLVTFRDVSNEHNAPIFWVEVLRSDEQSKKFDISDKTNTYGSRYIIRETYTPHRRYFMPLKLG